MILKENEIKDKDLREFWVSGGRKTAGLGADKVKRLKSLLVHLDTARSLNDIASGLGELREFHKLSGFDCRYALSVTGNYRITFNCEDASTGVVTDIEYEDYH